MTLTQPEAQAESVRVRHLPLSDLTAVTAGDCRSLAILAASIARSCCLDLAVSKEHLNCIEARSSSPASSSTSTLLLTHTLCPASTNTTLLRPAPQLLAIHHRILRKTCAAPASTFNIAVEMQLNSAASLFEAAGIPTFFQGSEEPSVGNVKFLRLSVWTRPSLIHPRPPSFWNRGSGWARASCAKRPS